MGSSRSFGGTQVPFDRDVLLKIDSYLDPKLDPVFNGDHISVAGFEKCWQNLCYLDNIFSNFPQEIMHILAIERSYDPCNI